MSDESKLDDLLTQLGTGRWNVVYFFGAAFWYMLLPPQCFSVVYLAPNLNNTCLPALEHNISYIAEDSCSYFRITSEGSLQEEPCTEFLYDDSIFSSTLTSEFGLVCGRAYQRAAYQSVYSLSSIIGSLVSGYAADRYGRKIVVVVSQVMYAATCISISFISNFNVILAFRFLLGALGTPTFYMLGMEVCETKNRSAVGILMALPWAFGMMMWGGAGYLIRDWRWLQLAVSLPIILMLPVLFLIDESPRWLIVTGRHDKALKVLRRASRLNKTTLPPEDVLKSIFDDIQLENEKPVTKTESMHSLAMGSGQERCTMSCPRLLRSHKMRVVTIALSVNLFISSLVYCGLSLSGAIYSSDPFLYMVLSGLMETPGYSLTAPLIKKFGRKNPSIIGFTICGVVILCLTVIPSDISWLVMTFAMLGKLAISGAFMILFVFEAELLPTEVRLQGLAVTIVSANIAAALSPYVADYLGPLVPWLPSVIFGLSSFVAALVLVPLPETLGRPLPDMIHDLEKLWRKKEKKTDAGDDSLTDKLTA